MNPLPVPLLAGGFAQMFFGFALTTAGFGAASGAGSSRSERSGLPERVRSAASATQSCAIARSRIHNVVFFAREPSLGELEHGSGRRGALVVTLGLVGGVIGGARGGASRDAVTTGARRETRRRRRREKRGAREHVDPKASSREVEARRGVSRCVYCTCY